MTVNYRKQIRDDIIITAQTGYVVLHIVEENGGHTGHYMDEKTTRKLIDALTTATKEAF